MDKTDEVRRVVMSDMWSVANLLTAFRKEGSASESFNIKDKTLADKDWDQEENSI